jgi:flagellar motor switch protein FliM
MPEFLSQRQIDDLFQGLSLVEEEKVLPFDLRRQARLPKEQQDACTAALRRFAETFSAHLEARLGPGIEIRLTDLEAVLFREFQSALAANCPVYLFGAGDGRQGAVELSIESVFLMLDRLFGGTGEVIPERRPLTTLELEVGRGMVERMLPILQDSFGGMPALAPDGLRSVCEPEKLAIARGDEMVLAAYFEIVTEQQRTEAALCLPMDRFGAAGRDESPQQEEAAMTKEQEAVRDLIAATVRQARVEVTARMPAFRMSTREIAQVAPGQVLFTGHIQDAAMEIRVNGRLRFLGSLGQARGQIGVRIAQTASEPEAERTTNEKQGRIL